MYFNRTRKTVSRASRVSALALTLGALATMMPQSSEADTLRAVMHSDLRLLDPITTTAHITRNHGYMIYDTLFSLDENMHPQMQMLAEWAVSEDGLKYTFKLRDGLAFHDGSPVTGEDVIASLGRWGARDAMGRAMMERVASMTALEGDPLSFAIELSEPYSLLIDSLSKPSSNVPFIMPAAIASTPPTEPISEHIGSGPFRWVADEYQPGVIAVYERNDTYIPRAESPSWASGGKVVRVDRVEWIVMPDAQTALNALIAGEIDFWEQPPADLLPLIAAEDEFTVHVTNNLGYQVITRINTLHPPFDNLAVRRAALLALDQRDVLAAMFSDTSLYRTCAAMFVCDTPLATDAGGTTLIDGSGRDEARELLTASGYDGAPVVILQPTDVEVMRSQPPVVAQALREVGFTVELQSLDWQTLIQRRGNRGTIDEGGWNIFFTFGAGVEVLNPITNIMAHAPGPETAWFGWPDVPAVQALLEEFRSAPDVEGQRSIAKRMQILAYENAYYVPLGQYFIPSVWSDRVSGVLDGPVPYFWNIEVQ